MTRRLDGPLACTYLSVSAGLHMLFIPMRFLCCKEPVFDWT